MIGNVSFSLFLCHSFADVCGLPFLEFVKKVGLNILKYREEFGPTQNW